MKRLGVASRRILIDISRRGRRDSPNRGNVARRQRGNGEAVTTASRRNHPLHLISTLYQPITAVPLMPRGHILCPERQRMQNALVIKTSECYTCNQFTFFSLKILLFNSLHQITAVPLFLLVCFNDSRVFYNSNYGTFYQGYRSVLQLR